MRRLNAIRALGRSLRRFDGRLSARLNGSEAVCSSERDPDIERFLRSLDLPDDPRRYVEDNLQRIVRSLALVPPPRGSGRVLELGAYMQMTPALACVLGYSDVRGAYYGELGRVDTKTSSVGGREVFRCEIDHFDAERDRFPYDDGRFETVMACEILEHLLHDPMHMLLEIHRVLEDGGAMVLTTPNVTSYTAVVRVLAQNGNPQVYSRYPSPADGHEKEVPHVREYAPEELRECVEAAGFHVEQLLTETVGEFDPAWVHTLLEGLRYPTAMRGELMFCVARKRSDRTVTRYPVFLYDR